MSLKTLITYDKAFQEILKKHLPRKEQFVTNRHDVPAFSRKCQILVPNTLSNPWNSSITGTAFDYLARFIVAKQLDDDRQRVMDSFVAENGLEEIQKREQDSWISVEPAFPRLIKRYEQARKRVKKYISDNKIDNYTELIPDVCFLARLDIAFRSSWVPLTGYGQLLCNETKETISDVANMAQVFFQVFIIGQIITGQSTVVFNPRFGDMSIVCGGADADILVDGVLYDFKSSKKLGYHWDEVAQIYGYYLLDCLQKIAMEHAAGSTLGEEINYIAFYRARSGIIEKFSTKEFVNEDLYETLIEIRDYLYAPQRRQCASLLGYDVWENRERVVENLTDEAILSWVQHR
ncbi:MAG: hypothetical protein E7321_10730 [Clostridiales bacterium]|nr:hypothetical protein [Clostridiales bacterium]